MRPGSRDLWSSDEACAPIEDVIDEAALAAMVDETIRPYRGLLDDEAVDEMRLAMLMMFTAHPEMSKIARAVLPAKVVEESGENADGSEEDADDPGQAGGSSA